MKFVIPVSLFGLILYICGCTPKQDLPAFVHINKPIFTDTSENQNIAPIAQDIKDAYLYIDNQLVGVYEIPATVPVLKEGRHKVQVFGGVIENGVASTRINYPFFNFYTDSITLITEGTTQLTPKIGYNASAIFALNEGFEGAGVNIENSENSTVGYQQVYKSTDSKVLDGNSCIKAVMLTDSDVVEIVPSQKFLFSTVKDMYLEFNYLSDADIFYGIDIYQSGNPLRLNMGGVRATATWKKAYIFLSDAANANRQRTLRPFLRINNPSNTSSTIYLDNIKLIYR